MDTTCIGKAVVEYLGEFPRTASTHGNTKKGTGSEYIRTSLSTKSKIMEKVKTDQSHSVYRDMILEDPMEAPWDLKQVQNSKHSLKKQESNSQLGNRKTQLMIFRH